VPLTAGAHHLATVTADLDRLIAFYTEVFDARLVADMREEGLRHVFLDLGGGFVLHPFQVPGVEVPQGEEPIFARGRIDHLALKAGTEEEFWTVRERIYRAGASDGSVTDMGILLSAEFVDPDGLWGEVCWDRPRERAQGEGFKEGWSTIRWPDRA
jgi:catechol 2,3-dioxygenase-like lactoylglutathione lyase family enzyme